MHFKIIIIAPFYKFIDCLSSDEFRRTKLVYSNKGGNKISKAKFDNLLMNLKYIPAFCHEYFKSVKFEESNLDKDFALASYSSDEESM